MPTTHFCTLLIPEPTLIGNFSILVRCQWGKIISKHSYFDTAMCSLKLGLNLKFSAQESDLAPFVGNGTRVKAPFEIKHRGLKLDGAIGQGEICNSLKSENFSKSFLSHIGKIK